MILTKNLFRSRTRQKTTKRLLKKSIHKSLREALWPDVVGMDNYFFNIHLKAFSMSKKAIRMISSSKDTQLVSLALILKSIARIESLELARISSFTSSRS